MATSENGCFIGGDTIDKVNHVYLNNVVLKKIKQTQYDTGIYDKRPCRGEGYIYNNLDAVVAENITTLDTTGVKAYGF